MVNENKTDPHKNMSFQKKKAALVQAGLGEEDLDSIIHDIKSGEASDLNNDGFDTQLSYLFVNAQMSVNDIIGRA